MNNIEILKNAIYEMQEQIEVYEEQGNVEEKEGLEEVQQAIENLIKENKELKEKIKGLECESEIRKYCKVDEVINDLTYYKNLAKEYQGNCIPKSKVKEEMQNDIKTNEHVILGGRRNGKTLEYGKRLGRIEMCKELLEEGDDK
ncbi:MAG: hypothetical protein J6N78_04180 [Clostridia bacterium]|nr:hypothetical protein [Clostridia bacterium]